MMEINEFLCNMLEEEIKENNKLKKQLKKQTEILETIEKHLNIERRHLIDYYDYSISLFVVDDKFVNQQDDFHKILDFFGLFEKLKPLDRLCIMENKYGKNAKICDIIGEKNNVNV